MKLNCDPPFGLRERYVFEMFTDRQTDVGLSPILLADLVSIWLRSAKKLITPYINMATHTASEYINSSSKEEIQEKKEVDWSLHNTGFICLKN